MAEHENLKSVKTVKRETALTYLELRKVSAWRTAIASAFCVLSPAPIILFGWLYKFGMGAKPAIILGISLLIIFLIFAVTLFILNALKNREYSFLDNSIFFISKNTAEIVKEKQEEYRETYERCNVTGTFLCAASPLIILAVSSYNNDLLLHIAAAVCLLIAAIGIFLLTLASMKWAGFNKLLQQSEYAQTQKKSAQFIHSFAAFYWMISVILYVTISCVAEIWAESSIIEVLKIAYLSNPLYFFSLSAILFFVAAMLIKAYFKTRDEAIREEDQYFENEENDE